MVRVGAVERHVYRTHASAGDVEGEHIRTLLNMDGHTIPGLHVVSDERVRNLG